MRGHLLVFLKYRLFKSQLHCHMLRVTIRDQEHVECHQRSRQSLLPRAGRVLNAFYQAMIIEYCENSKLIGICTIFCLLSSNSDLIALRGARMIELDLQPWILCSGETSLASLDLKLRILTAASVFCLEGDSCVSCKLILEAKPRHQQVDEGGNG